MSVPALPGGFAARPMVAGDAPAVVGLVARAATAIGGRATLSESVLTTLLGVPGFVPQQDTIVVEDGDGAVVALEIVVHLQPFVTAQLFGVVDPERTGRGIGSALLAWARSRAGERADGAPAGARVDLQASIDVRDEPGGSLLTGSGFERSRYFLELHRDLDDTFDPVPFPAGVEVRPFLPGEEHALYRAFVDAFRDHWGWVDRPYDDGFRRFFIRLEMDAYDPACWWVAVADDEIIGFNLCVPSHGGDDRFAWCDQIGVRRPWRRRGLARALLLHSFAAFRRRGCTTMGLAVDADSLTGATDLYEQVGMSVAEEHAVYRSILRDGEVLTVEDLS